MCPFPRAALPRALIVVALSSTFALARGSIPDDPLVERLRARVLSGEYRAVGDTIPPLLEAAVAEGDSLRVGRLICLRGQAELGVGEVSKSLQTLARARAMAEAAGDTISWMTALGVSSLALNHQGRFEEALVPIDRQIELARARHDSIARAYAELSRGYAELNRGRLETAREAYQTAIELFEAPEYSRWRLTAMTGRGRVEADAGQLEAARSTYARIVATAHEIGDQSNEADALNNLGTIERYHGDLDLAVAYYERAFRVQSPLHDPVQHVDIMNNVASVWGLLGNYGEAATMLESVRSFVAERGATLAYLEATEGLARLRLRQGRAHSAGRLYRELLDTRVTPELRAKATVGLATSLARADSLSSALAILETLRPRESLGTDPLTLSSTILMCQILRRLGRLDEALRLARPMTESLDAEPQAAGMLAEYARCVAESGERDAAWQALEHAVSAIECRRESVDAYELRETLGESLHPLIVDVAGVLGRRSGEDSDRLDPRSLFDLLQRLKARTLFDRISAPNRPAIRPGSTARLDVVQQQLLGPRDCLLDYFVGREFTLSFAVTPDEIRFRVLPIASNELETLATLFSEMAATETLQESRYVPWEDASRHLKKLLFAGDGDLVETADRLVVSPDGALATIPFGLLPAFRDPDTILLMEKPVLSIPSVSLLSTSRRSCVHVTHFATLLGTAGRLEGADEEVRTIAERFGGVQTHAAWTKRERPSIGRAEVIHIAAHSEIDGQRPWHSGIEIRSVAETAADSTILLPTHLRAADILDQSLHARLVVLSSCESGLGRISHGEGVLGLSSAFLVTGVSAVVSTLWPVDDGVTRDLMLEFYDRLAAGDEVADALRAAQLRIRARPETRSPRYWAGFIVTAREPLELGLERRHARRLPLAVAGLVLSLVGVLGWRTRRRRPSDAGL